MCEEIQKEWSAEERARRASGRSHGDGKLTETGWTVPVVRLNINAK